MNAFFNTDVPFLGTHGRELIFAVLLVVTVLPRAGARSRRVSGDDRNAQRADVVDGRLDQLTGPHIPRVVDSESSGPPFWRPVPGAPARPGSAGNLLDSGNVRGDTFSSFTGNTFRIRKS